MRKYELVVVLRPDADDKTVGILTKKIEKMITAKPGNIVSKNDWGIKKLAYSIAKQPRGRYLFWLFEQNPDAIGELERALRLDETVIRFLTTLEAAPLIELKGERPESKPEGARKRGPSQAELLSKVNYKNPDILARFITETGRIVPRRMSGMDAKQQAKLAAHIKRARQIALLSPVHGFYQQEYQG